MDTVKSYLETLFTAVGDYTNVVNGNIDSAVKSFYLEKVAVDKNQAVTLCLETLGQKSKRWHAERQLRITGSICYDVMTYTKNKKADWPNKVKNLFFPTFKGNDETLYGLRTEPSAIKAYENAFKCTVMHLGLVVQPDLAFLGFSPDGMVQDKNRLIEIKCPTVGKSKTIVDCLENLKYLTGSLADRNLSLKRKHKFYGQIQMGMGLLKCTNCHFVVYSSFDNTLIAIEIQFDQNFFSKIINLKHVYFNEILPVIISKLN